MRATSIFQIALEPTPEEQAEMDLAHTTAALDAVLIGDGFIRLQYCSDGSMAYSRVDPSDVMIRRPVPPVVDPMRTFGDEMGDLIARMRSL